MEIILWTFAIVGLITSFIFASFLFFMLTEKEKDPREMSEQEFQEWHDEFRCGKLKNEWHNSFREKNVEFRKQKIYQWFSKIIKQTFITVESKPF